MIWKNVIYFWLLLIPGVLVVTMVNSVIGFKPDASVTPVTYIVHVVTWVFWGALFSAAMIKLPFTNTKATT